MLSKPSPHSLKTGLKKSKFFLLFFCLISFAFLPGSLGALETANSYYLSSDSLEINVHVRDIPLSDIHSYLSEGETSKIRYEIRLFQKRRGILSLLGDRMLADQTRELAVRYDRLSSNYVLSKAGKEFDFTSFASLMQAYSSIHFSFENFSENTKDEKGAEEFYFRSRITLFVRTLTPPFTLLEPFLPKTYERSSWEETPLRSSREQP